MAFHRADWAAFESYVAENAPALRAACVEGLRAVDNFRACKIPGEFISKFMLAAGQWQILGGDFRRFFSVLRIADSLAALDLPASAAFFRSLVTPGGLLDATTPPVQP